MSGKALRGATLMDPKQLVSLLAQIALFLVVISFGLQARWSDVLSAMRDKGLVVRGFVAVNVVVPVAAILVCSLFSLDPAVETAIIIMAISPLAPLAPGKMRKGGAEISTVIGLYVALIMLAIFLVPLSVSILSAVFPVDAAISVASVAKMVARTILLPLLAGVLFATLAPGPARAAGRIASIVGMVGVLLLLCLIAFVQRGAAAGLIGDGTLLAIVLIIGLAVLGGHLLGRADRATSNLLAMAAAIRHPGMAALIIQANFNEPRMMLTVVLFLVTSVIATSVYQLLATVNVVAARQRRIC